MAEAGGGAPAGAAGLSGWVTHPWVAEARRQVRFGVMAGPRDDWPALRDFVARLEALGLDSYWASDHPLDLPDCWTTLAALAVSTRTIRLGTLVSCVVYQRPALLARLAADVDRLSDGRLVLGLGIGDHAPEFTRLGLPFTSPADRQQALAETIQVIRGLWGPHPFTYRGRQTRLAAARLRPGPVQRPRVPLLIAGGGERVTLRQVARFADAANFGPHPYTGGALSLADVRRKLAVLDEYCRAVGRPPDSVLRTHVTLRLVLAPTEQAVQARLAALAPALRAYLGASLVAGTPDQVVAAHFRGLAAAGARYFIVGILPGDDETVDLLGRQVAPALRDA